MNSESRLTKSLEDYIECIYLLKQKNGDVRLTDIAIEMNCTKPSVSKAICLLRNEGFLQQEKYGQIQLTTTGEKVAKEVYFRHKIILSFLIDKLGVSEKIARDDACKMEHVISRETLLKIIDYMKDK